MQTSVQARVFVVAIISMLAPSTVDAQAAARACTATPAFQVPIRLDGARPVYVEPQAVVSSGDRILVAGNPTYVWYLKDDRVVAAGRDSIFGIVVQRDGRAQAVPSPLPPGRVHSVRAAPHADGQWAVVFVEAAPPPRFASPVNVEAYWFGVTDGTRWLRMEKLPALEGKFATDNASALIRTERGYAMAVPVTLPSGSRAAVFSESGGRWNVELVAGGAVYTSLTTDGRELMLGVVYADTIARNPTGASSSNGSFIPGDLNSLWLYRTADNGTRWSPRTRLVDGLLQQPVFHPRLHWSGRGLEIGWIAKDGIGGDTHIGAITRAHTLAVMDSLVVATQHIELTTATNGRPFWLTTDAADSTGTTRTPSLRIWTITGAKATQVLGGRTPFHGVSGFAALDTSLMVVGPMRGTKPFDPAVMLHLHAYTLDCD